MAKKEKKQEVKEEVVGEVVVVDLHNPGFDPEIPEQKQRWLR